MTENSRYGESWPPFEGVALRSALSMLSAADIRSTATLSQPSYFSLSH